MMPDNDFDDIEVISPDSPDFFSKDKTFSHETLVMRSYMRVQDALAQEMVEGHNSSITDSNGKTIIVYHKDTRAEAIECIETLKNVMVADIKGTENETKINELIQKLKEKFDEQLKKQSLWYNSLSYEQQKEASQTYPDLIFTMSFNNLYPDLPFGQEFLAFKIKTYRLIFEQLELCLSERKYFKRGKYGG